MKTCKITNSRVSYILEVNDKTILFHAANAADYFQKHYEDLGYQVERDENYWKKQSTKTIKS